MKAVEVFKRKSLLSFRLNLIFVLVSALFALSFFSSAALKADYSSSNSSDSKLDLNFSSSSFRPNLISKEDSPQETTSWYIVKLGGVPAGFAREESKRVMTPHGPIIRSFSELRLSVKRLGVRVELVSSSETEEKESGELLRSSLVMKLSNLETITRAEIGEKEIMVRSSAGGQEYTQKISFNDGLLGPEGINHLTLNFLKKPGDEIEYATYLPEVNQVIRGKRKLESWETLILPGFTSPFKTLRVVETVESLGIKRTLWFEDRGRLIQSEETSPLGELKIYLASKEEALAAASAELLTDIPFESTLVRSNVRLPSARLIERIKLRLKFRQAEVAMPAFSSFYQRVLSMDKDSLTIEIEKPPSPAQKSKISRSEKDKKEIEECLQANTYLNIDDPLIRKMATELTQNISDDLEKALRLRDWVSQNLFFDAGIVFAPATEVISQRRGTCVSFAILLATLARAAGLPARLVMGYAYLNGVWGGHAWTEIYVTDAWLPFDAALPSPDVADAARLALVASSLNQGLGEVIGTGLRFFSKIDIEILAYQLQGQMFPAPPVLSEVKGNYYFNPGLGLEVKVPDSLVLAEMNKAWPDNTVLVMKNEKEEVRLLQQTWRPVKDMENYLRQLAGPDFSRSRLEIFNFQGQKAYRMINKNQAVAFFLRGTDLWQVAVRSSEARPLLEKALRAIHFKIKISPLN